jgi:signal peptidase II
MNTPTPGSGRTSGPRVPRGRAVLFGAIALAALVSDLWSKHAVFDLLGNGGQTPWTKRWFGGWMTFNLHTTLNEGALWGIGQGGTPIFAALSVIAAAGIVYWLFFRGGAQSLWLTTALGMVLGGTLGNLYDRLGLHHEVNLRTGEAAYAVRDFLHFTFFNGSFEWAVFNLADVYLVTGAIMLVLQSLRADPMAATAPAPAAESATPAADLTASAR